jgi:hypothetical protein
MDDLPGTIRDAVLITRELGLRYLWVDALCILQGQDEAAQLDWRQHSAIMGDIYGNAFVTIAAAAAPHADNGIFHERVLPDTVKFLSAQGVRKSLWISARMKIETAEKRSRFQSVPGHYRKQYSPEE